MLNEMHPLQSAMLCHPSKALPLDVADDSPPVDPFELSGFSGLALLVALIIRSIILATGCKTFRAFDSCCSMVNVRSMSPACFSAAPKVGSETHGTGATRYTPSVPALATNAP